MTTDAEVIRAERHDEIGSIIQRDAATIIDGWARRAAEEQPDARRLHHEALLDHLPGLLAAMGKHLTTAGDPDGVPHRPPARQHGKQRWEMGWSITEVVRDYRILRLVILEHLGECLRRPLWQREAQAVGLALDEAIEASVEQYVQSRDEQARSLQLSLEQADCRKNEFLAILAHELRNPLAPLRNSLEVMHLAGDTPAAFGQVRELMERQVGQMTRLVEDLLDVARVAQGKLVLRRERFDLRNALEQAAQMNCPLRESRRHSFSVSLPPEALWVEGDPARLVQVVVNLLNNAAKYTPCGGRVSLSAGREGGEVVVRVKDNGIGIPPAKLSQVFDLFTQVDPGKDRTQGGLGIGLTLVRRLVELHGGSIVASSHGEGQGSEFVVRLPAAEGPDEAVREVRKLDRPTGRHILVIEDDRDGRESLALLLGMVGHRVDVAEDGPRGIDAAVALRPEIALIDIGLPGLDGYAVARQVRAALGGGVLLIALTGHSQPVDRRRAMEAGFDVFLVKPVELQDLQVLLAEHRPPAS